MPAVGDGKAWLCTVLVSPCESTADIAMVSGATRGSPSLKSQPDVRRRSRPSDARATVLSALTQECLSCQWELLVAVSCARLLEIQGVRPRGSVQVRVCDREKVRSA